MPFGIMPSFMGALRAGRSRARRRFAAKPPWPARPLPRPDPEWRNAAKPNASIPGCSGHTHYSLWDAATNTNLFHDPADPRGMSTLMKHFLAGQLRCLPDILPMYMPFVNRYDRIG